MKNNHLPRADGLDLGGSRLFRMCKLLPGRSRIRPARLTALAVLAATALAGGSLKAATPLVTNGAAASVIVIADQPQASQKLAAQELQYHLQKMSGARIAILPESQVKDNQRTLILVGQSRRVSALGVDTTKLPAETLVVRTVGHALILAGNDSGATPDAEDTIYDSVPDAPIYTPIFRGRTGTLYAVYKFLEDELGCRWLWPGSTGEVIPKHATVEVGALDITETPVLFRRHMRSGLTERLKKNCLTTMPAFMAQTGDAFDRMANEERTWLKRMRMGEAFPLSYGHAFTTWWERYGKTDPELFALLPNGQRGPADAKRPEFVKMCVSNPKLITMLIDQFMKQRAKNPGLRYLNACENDGSAGWCTCDRCKSWDIAIDPKMRQSLIEAGKDGSDVDTAFATQKDGLPLSLSNRYFRFMNELARELRKVAPDASVITYAYSRYKDVPVDLKLEPNMLVGLNSTFNMYPMNAVDFAEARRNFDGWYQTRCPMFLRPNAIIFSPALGVPWSAAHQMGEDFRYALARNTLATDYDSLTGEFATAGPMYYVMARLHWDTSAKVDDLLNEFYGGFGPCAPAVKAYFDHYEAMLTATFNRPDIDKELKKIEPVGSRLARWRGMPLYYTPEVLAQGRALIDRTHQIAAASGDEDLIARVRVLELGQRHGELEIQATSIRNRIHPDRVIKPGEIIDTTELMPVLNELFAVRKELAASGGDNVFHVADYELNTNWDMILSSVWHRAQLKQKL